MVQYLFQFQRVQQNSTILGPCFFWDLLVDPEGSQTLAMHPCLWNVHTSGSRDKTPSCQARNFRPILVLICHGSSVGVDRLLWISTTLPVLIRLYVLRSENLWRILEGWFCISFNWCPAYPHISPYWRSGWLCNFLQGQVVKPWSQQANIMLPVRCLVA